MITCEATECKTRVARIGLLCRDHVGWEGDHLDRSGYTMKCSGCGEYMHGDCICPAIGEGERCDHDCGNDYCDSGVDCGSCECSRCYELCDENTKQAKRSQRSTRMR